MKLKKKSGLIGLISVLAGVSVVSVGFAAWVVSAGDTQTVDGYINVETMTDERHTIKDLSESLDAVKYGAPTATETNGTVTGDVLSYRNVLATDKENLDISFSFKIRNFSTAKFTIGLVATSNNDNKTTGSVYYKQGGNPEYKNEAGEGYTQFVGYDAALQRGYVGALPAYNSLTSSATNITVTPAAAADQDGYTEISVTLNFKWGSKFTGSYKSASDNDGEIVNPYTFYNNVGTAYSVTEKNAAAADAVATLGNLQSYLTGVKYTMTIVTEHNA